MSLFTRSRPADVKRAVSFQDVWGRGLEWNPSGVNESSVTSLDAVAACIGLMCDVVTMLPVDVFRDRAGVADPMVSTPQLVANPSTTVDPLVWRSQAMVSCLLWGNAYGLVTTRDSFGHPTTVDWLDPQLLAVEEFPFRPPVYRYAGQLIESDRLMVLVGRYVRPGSSLGVAPLERFRETFSLALEARKFGADWFKNGAIPSAIITSKGQVTEDHAKTIKRRVKESTRNRDALALGDDVNYQQVQVSPNESQFGETIDRQVVAVARVFGIPPEMVAGAMSGSSVTYANREQRAIDFLTFSADPWLVRFEQMWTRNLPRPQYARFNRGALLRVDLLTRYQAHDIAVRSGLAPVNERRALEDLAPLPDRDEALWPPYAASVTALAPSGGDA